ncbi:MAG: flagellar biosynthesis anti-sigma factor FlgM [Terriglobales bacterium]
MRIQNPNLDPSLAAQQRPEEAHRITPAHNSVVPSGSGATSTSGDQAKLGSSTVELTAKALAQPEVRQEQVQQLRAQITGGTYVVNTSQIAEAMLNDPQTGMGTRGDG